MAAAGGAPSARLSITAPAWVPCGSSPRRTAPAGPALPRSPSPASTCGTRSCRCGPTAAWCCSPAPASTTRRSNYLTRSPRVCFSDDGVSWTAPARFLAEDHWLWRVTWHGEVGYGVSKLGEGRLPPPGVPLPHPGRPRVGVAHRVLSAPGDLDGERDDGEDPGRRAHGRPRPAQLDRRQLTAVPGVRVDGAGGAHGGPELPRASRWPHVGLRPGPAPRRRRRHRPVADDGDGVRAGDAAAERRRLLLPRHGLARGPAVDELLLLPRGQGLHLLARLRLP